MVRRGGAILAELKPASPSEGTLLLGSAGTLLDAYAGGADAISVLTDGDHFGGDPALLRQAHATGLPLLMKDFVVDEAQLDCALHNGASAVLLIERVLVPARREELVEAAHARGLEVLLEVFDAKEWQAARSSKAELVGVNARDLDTLRVDPAAALVLLGAVAQERPAVALSGIHDRAGARLAWAAGAGGILIGTALLRSPDPALLLRSLRRPIAKVCGLRTLADIEAAAEAGADLVGFIVGSPGSPRDLPLPQARGLVAAARSRALRTVLVTRSGDLDAVAEWCSEVRPDFLQLHTRASAAWVAAVAPVQVLFAAGPGSALPPDGAGVLLDGAAEGGAGVVRDWDLAHSLLANEKRPSLIAGGLDATNAAAAVRASGAWGADASSRLESSPGHKDAGRIAAFVRAVHSA